MTEYRERLTPHAFIDDLRPRTILHPMKNQEAVDRARNDQAYSPLQVYIDSQEPFTDDELRALAARIQQGDKTAPAEFADRSLKVIRRVARRMNLALNQEEDELINIAVAHIMESREYIDPKYHNMAGLVWNLAGWGILQKIGDSTRSVDIHRNTFGVLSRIRKKLGHTAITTSENDFEEAARIIEKEGLGEEHLPARFAAQAFRVIGALSIENMMANEDYADGLRSVELDSHDLETRFEAMADKDELESLLAIAVKYPHLVRKMEFARLYFYERMTLRQIAGLYGYTFQNIQLALAAFTRELREIHTATQGLSVDGAKALINLDVAITSRGKKFRAPKSRFSRGEEVSRAALTSAEKAIEI